MTLAESPRGGEVVEGLDRSLDLAGVALAYPVINASGTFDAIAALRTFGDGLRENFPFAAFVSKTITPEPRGGNRPPRLWETPAGMINSIGLPNKGLDGFLRHDLPELATLPVPLIVSLAAFGHDDFARMVEAVGARPEVAAIELNVSCPNVKSGCVIGSDPDEMTALMSRLRGLGAKPLIVKLTPNVSEIGPIATAAQRGGADAISLINTLRAMAIDQRSGQPALGAASGGLSGPAVRAVAVEMTHTVCAHVDIPVIGMGGIQCGQDASEFFAAGADCVAIGTENFRDPSAGTRIRGEIAAALAERGQRAR